MKRITSIFLSILGLALLFSSCTKENKKAMGRETQHKSVFSLPFPDLNPAYTEYEIQAEKGMLLSYKTGSKIIVPANAFLDKDGNIVKGKVKLRYREFHNPLEIFLAGIPMAYDSAGTSFTFESAGMIEMNASFKEKPVFVNSKSKIEVQMVSVNNSPKFSLYQLDTTSGKWNYQGKDEIKAETYEEEIAKLPALPVPPKQASPIAFDLGNETTDLPEFRMYKNVMFEPVNNSQKDIGGTDIKIKYVGDGVYDVLFINDIPAYGYHSEKSVKCYLAFRKGTDYEKAMEVYQEKNKHLLKQREEKKKEIDLSWRKYDETCKKYYIAKANYDFQMSSEREKVTRLFQVYQFGYINSDCPSKLPIGAIIKPIFEDASGKIVSIHDLNLVEFGRNILFKFYNNEIRFDPSKDNIIWGFTNDGKLAYSTREEFKKIKQKEGECRIKVSILNKKIKNQEQLQEILFQ